MPDLTQNTVNEAKAKTAKEGIHGGWNPWEMLTLIIRAYVITIGAWDEHNWMCNHIVDGQRVWGLSIVDEMFREPT